MNIIKYSYICFSHNYNKQSTMTEKQWYEVGGHQFCISTPPHSDLLENLTNCHPFCITEKQVHSSDTPIFRLEVKDSPRKPDIEGTFVIQFEGEHTYISLYETTKGELLFSIASDSSQTHVMAMLKTDTQSYQATLTLASKLHLTQKIFAVNNTLMLLYALSTACRNTLLVHASVIAYQNRAYVFLGRSGTGKSTHSRLWLQYIEGTHLLNDDNPVIRIDGEKAIVYGSPWSGKTPCYLNQSMPLGAIVRLSQFPENKIEQLKGAVAYAAVAPSASAIKWKTQYADGLHTTLSLLTSTAGIYHLQCRPDKEAALMCCHTVCKQTEA